MSDATVWQSRDPENVLWAHWDDDYVLYHRPSGKTHFVNAATAQLLTSVLREPKSASAAADELAAAQEAAGDAEFFSEVARLLERLEHVGLVERCDG
jgi:PqqD family protein of HPr-rel-A system